MKFFSEQMTLGELEDALKKLPGEITVAFDFCDLVPDKLRSYRGYYEQIALSFKLEGRCTVQELLEACAKAIGQTFEGYKGGEYRMGRDTGVWVANYGKCHGYAIVGVEPKRDVEGGAYWATLKTAKVDED